MSQITIGDLLEGRDGQRWIAVSSEVDGKIQVKPAKLVKATKKKLTVNVKESAFIIAAADVEHVIKLGAKKKKLGAKKKLAAKTKAKPS